MYRITNLYFDDDGNEMGAVIVLNWFDENGDDDPTRRLRHGVAMTNDNIGTQFNAIRALTDWAEWRTGPDYNRRTIRGIS